MKESFIPSLDGKIHVLSQTGSTGLPVLFVPGMFGVAEHFLGEAGYLKDCTIYSMSLRGRGKSSAPETGYTLQDHVDDVTLVIDSMPFESIILMAHSYGILYAVAAAHVRKNKIKKMILFDRGLTAVKIQEDWLEFVKLNPPQYASIEMAKRLMEASEPLDLWGKYIELNCDTLILKGELQGSHLPESDVTRFEKLGAKIVRLPNSNHYPLQPDANLYLSSLKDFITNP